MPDLQAKAVVPSPSRLRSALPYTLAGVGAALVGGALGVYLWNRKRYDDWQAGNTTLKNEGMGSAAYRQQATANNNLAASLTSANHAVLGLSIAGGALVALGATVFYVDHVRVHRTAEVAFGWGGGLSANVKWSCVW
jgi:hypothetical protein